jgi:protein-tyrosine phosphatase
VNDIGWIDLEGVVNMRDVGGLPTRDGRTLRHRRLIRSDNLQDLTPSDVRHLVEELGVTDVVDLRTELEVHHTGPGPLRQTSLTHHHHSFFSDDREVSGEEALAWRRRRPVRRDDDYWASHYLGYLDERPDSVSAALDVVARSPGGTIVHCAAGKDRTGTVVGLALDVAGVPAEAIIGDYVATAMRLERILERLLREAPYTEVLSTRAVEDQLPRAETMERILAILQRDHGGAAGWLGEHGWSEEDVDRLRRSLIGEE